MRLIALLRMTACRAAKQKAPISTGNRNSAPPRPMRPPRAPMIAPLPKAATTLRGAVSGSVAVSRRGHERSPQLFISAQACVPRRRGNTFGDTARPLTQAEHSGGIAARIDLDDFGADRDRHAACRDRVRACPWGFAALAGRAGKSDCVMIDSTYLKAHRTAASLLKNGLFPPYRAHQGRGVELEAARCLAARSAAVRRPDERQQRRWACYLTACRRQSTSCQPVPIDTTMPPASAPSPEVTAKIGA